MNETVDETSVPITDDGSDPGPGDAIATLAVTRVQIESARWHLRQAVEIGNRLEALLGAFDVVLTDSVPAVRDGARVAVEIPVAAARATVARARASLAELAKVGGA